MHTGCALTVSGGGGGWCIPEILGKRNLKKTKFGRPPPKLETPPWKIGDPPNWRHPPKKLRPPKKLETPRPKKLETPPPGPDQVPPPGTRPDPPVDRHTLVKILPWPNFVAAGKKRKAQRFKGHSWWINVGHSKVRLLQTSLTTETFRKIRATQKWPQICRAENISEIETHRWKVCLFGLCENPGYCFRIGIVVSSESSRCSTRIPQSRIGVERWSLVRNCCPKIMINAKYNVYRRQRRRWRAAVRRKGRRCARP